METTRTAEGRSLAWEMPSLLNEDRCVGAARIFLHRSQCFLFGCLLILGFLRGHNLHPWSCVSGGGLFFKLSLEYMADIVRWRWRLSWRLALSSAAGVADNHRNGVAPLPWCAHSAGLLHVLFSSGLFLMV